MSEPHQASGVLHWSDSDLESMEWHDVHFHAQAAFPEVYEYRFDIDYIVQWLCPVPPAKALAFMVAPATLVFEHVSALDISLSSQSGDLSLKDLRREDEQRIPAAVRSTWRWILEFNEGVVSLRGTGFRQYLRRSPLLSNAQRLDDATRGGVSFKTEFEQKFGT